MIPTDREIALSLKYRHIGIDPAPPENAVF